jgi:hypothetical protein
MKPSPGSRSGLKNPLGLLESSIYNSFKSVRAFGNRNTRKIAGGPKPIYIYIYIYIYINISGFNSR